MRACIVDDDFTSRVLLAEFLEDQGWETILFNHPDTKSDKNTSLINELSSGKVTLLFMDVRFGRDEIGLSLGLNTVQSLVESNILNSYCMIIFISQFGRNDNNFNSIEALLKKRKIKFEWFDKPFDFVKLYEKIAQFKYRLEGN